MMRSALTAVVVFCGLVAMPAGARAACPESCYGHGVCVEDTCLCDPGWSGAACEKDDGSCIGACSGNGVCTFGKCLCLPGYMGPDCSLVEGCAGGCGLHGKCVFDQCQCELGWSGAQCATGPETCPADCSGRGLCQYGKCFCEPGFSGEDCAKEATCPAQCSGRGLCQYGKCFCEPGFSGEDCAKRDGTVLETVSFDNPIFESGVGTMTSVLALGVAPEVVIAITDAKTGEELQATRHPLPPNLVSNGVVRSLGFSGGVALTSVQGSFQLRYGLAVESPDPNDPGVVLLDFDIPSLDAPLPEQVLEDAVDATKDAAKDAKPEWKDGAEIAERVAKLTVLAGIADMDAGVFAEGSWAAAAERAVLQAGLEGAGVRVRVVSPGVTFSEQALWETFLASLPADCGAEGTAFGDFGTLPKECRPKGKLVFKAGPKNPPPQTVATFGIIGRCGFTQDESRACGGASYFRPDDGGGFVHGTTAWFDVRALAGGVSGNGAWPPAAATPATIGAILSGGDPVSRQIARHADGASALDALGLPDTKPGLTEVGVTTSGGGTTATKIRRRTKGGFVVDIDGIEPTKQPSSGGSGTGSWLGGYEVP